MAYTRWEVLLRACSKVNHPDLWDIQREILRRHYYGKSIAADIDLLRLAQAACASQSTAQSSASACIKLPSQSV